MSVKKAKVWLYSALLHVRPAQLGSFLKICLGVRRQVIATKKGLVFRVDPASVFGFQLMREGIYEPQMIRLLELVLRPSDTFIDVGGGEGYFSILASQLMPKGWVHCIEPQTRQQAIIRENICLNKSSRIKLYRIALSDNVGKVKLYLKPSTNPTASGILRTGKVGFASEIVPSTTLDLFFAEHAIEHARLIKVDCEGAEHIVICGAMQILSRKAIDFIAMEYHPMVGPQGPERCTRTHMQLIVHGYVLTKVNGQHIYHLPGFHEILKPLGNIRVNCGWDE